MKSGVKKCPNLFRLCGFEIRSKGVCFSFCWGITNPPGLIGRTFFDGGLQIRRDAIISRKDLPKRPERAEAPSPGHRPGLDNNQQSRPVRAKALYIARYFKAFALTGRLVCAIRLPRALPWARSFCPFRACCQKLASVLSLQQMTVGAGQQPCRAFFIPGNEKKKPK